MAAFRTVFLFALLVGCGSAQELDRYGNPCQHPAQKKELTPGAKAGIGITVAAAALGGSIAAVESNEDAKQTAEDTFDDVVLGVKKVFSKKKVTGAMNGAKKVLTSFGDAAKRVFNLSNATLPTLAPITVAPPPPPPPHAKMSAKAVQPPPPPPHAKMSGTVAKTVTTSAVEAGATELPVASQAGFEVGQVVVLDGGTPKEEKKKIVGFGPLLFDSPLAFAHSPGATVTADTMPHTVDSSGSSSGTSADSLAFLRSGFLDTGDSFGSDGSSGFNASGSSGFHWSIWVWLVLAALVFIGIAIACPLMKKKKQRVKRATGPLSARHVSRTSSAEHAAYPASAFEAALEQAPLMDVPKLEVSSAALQMPQLPPFYEVVASPSVVPAPAAYAPVTTSYMPAPVTNSYMPAPVTTSYMPPASAYMGAAQPAPVLATSGVATYAPTPVMAAPIVMERVANIGATSPSMPGYATAPAMMGGFATPPVSGGFGFAAPAMGVSTGGFAAPAMMGGLTPPVPGGFAAPTMGGYVSPPVPGGFVAPTMGGFVTPPVPGGPARILR